MNTKWHINIDRDSMKKRTTVILTNKQLQKLKTQVEETGNSRNSIVRTAINEYFQKKINKNFGG